MARVTCPACSSFNEEGALFCDQCGSSLRGLSGRRRRYAGALVFTAAAAVIGIVALMDGRWWDSTAPATSPGPVPAGRPGPNARPSVAAPVRPVTGAPMVSVQDAPVAVTEVEGAWEPAAVPVSVARAGPWVRVEARDAQGQVLAVARGARIAGGLVVCGLRVFAGAAEILVTQGEHTTTVAETAGWDLARGFGLLAANGDGDFLATASARHGTRARAIDGTGASRDVVLMDIEELGLADLPLHAAPAQVSDAGDAFLQNDEGLLAVAWYPRVGFAGVALFGRLDVPDAAAPLSLAAWNARVWRGSAYEAVLNAFTSIGLKDYARGVLWLEQALGAEEQLWPLLAASLAGAYLKWAGEAGAAGNTQEAVRILARALEVLPDSKEVLLVLARDEAALGLHEDALRHTLRAFELSPELWESSWFLVEERYLQLAKARDGDEALQWLDEAVGVLAESWTLRVELGTRLFNTRRFAEAAGVWEEAYALRRDAHIGEMIAEARRRAAARADLVVIRFPSAAGTVRAPVRFARRLDVPCIIDTGATYTAIPRWAVKELGIALENATQVVISTASDRVTVPMVTMGAVSLGHLEVGPLEVLVLDLPEGPDGVSPGLLGMNFLRHFKFKIEDVDAGMRELSIGPR